MEEKGEKNQCQENVGLRREVGLASAVNFLLSYVLGTGIFVTPGNVLAESGSVGMSLLIWVLCGFISFLACLPFGELSTAVPKSGSMYIYLYTAFNNCHPFFGGLPAFTFFWMMYVIILPCSIALAAILFADYTFIIVQGMVGNEQIANEAFLKNCLGASCLVLIGVLNCISVKIYVKSQDLLSYIKLAAIAFIVGCGLYLFCTGKALKFNPGFEGTNLSIQGITRAIYFGLYTYDGGCFITNITEEMKNPEKNILRSILIGLTITTLAYVLLSVTFLSALTPEEIASGTTVIAEFAYKLFGFAGGAIAAAIVCLSLLSAVMSGVFYASRIGYVAAREGHMLEFLCCIHRSRRTPAPAVIVQVILSLCYFFIGGDSGVLIGTYAFFIWISYGVTMISVFVLRKLLPNASRPYRVPTVVPAIIFIISCHLFIISLMSGQPGIILTFLICITLSTIVYYVFVYKKIRFAKLGKLQSNIQHLLGLVPPSEEPIY